MVLAGSAFHRGNLRAVVVSAHAHTQAWGSPCPFLAPLELNVRMRRKRDYDDHQVPLTLLQISGLRDMINTNGYKEALFQCL